MDGPIRGVNIDLAIFIQEALRISNWWGQLGGLIVDTVALIIVCWVVRSMVSAIFPPLFILTHNFLQHTTAVSLLHSEEVEVVWGRRGRSDKCIVAKTDFIL